MQVEYYSRLTQKGNINDYAKFNDIEFVFNNRYFVNFKHGYLHTYIYKYFNNLDTIPNGYCVHHIDHNKNNNDIYNLQLLTHSEHSKLHHKGRKFIIKPSNLTQEMINDWFNGISYDEFKTKYNPNTNALTELKQKYHRERTNSIKGKIDKDMVNDVLKGLSLVKFINKYNKSRRVWDMIRNGDY